MTKHKGLPRWHSKIDWRTTFCAKDINNRRCSCGIPWLESSFEHDAESMKTTLQWETEHKRWGRKQKHRGEDDIRNPYQSFATSCGKMPVDMLHNMPLGIWNCLLGRMIDEVTSLLVKAHTKGSTHCIRHCPLTVWLLPHNVRQSLKQKSLKQKIRRSLYNIT